MRDVMLRRGFVVLLVWMQAAACERSTASPTPVIAGVMPSLWIAGALPETVSIDGQGFYVHVPTDVAHAGPAQAQGRFHATVGGVSIPSVVWISNERLDATPPPGLAIGQHELVVTLPSGNSATLVDAVQVVDFNG